MVCGTLVVTGSSSGYTHYDEIRINGYIQLYWMDQHLHLPKSTIRQIRLRFRIFHRHKGITGKIFKSATVYTIHATQPTSNVVIKNTGSYVSVFTTASTAYLTNAVTVSATPDVSTNTIEDSAPDVPTAGTPLIVAFHQGTFSDGGDPYSHGSITMAATAGHVYSDTVAGEYTWGTLTSGTDTADRQGLHKI